MLTHGELEQIEPAREFARPTLRVRIKVRYFPSQEMPLSFMGKLRFAKNQYIGTVAVGVYGGSNVNVSVHEILVRKSNETARDSETRVEFLFPLQESEIELIQRRRETNPQDDIRLSLEVQAQSLELKFDGTAVDYVKRNIPGMGKEEELVTAHDFARPGNFDAVFLTRSGQTGMQFMTFQLSDISLDIPSSRWVRDYAPAFGIGETLVIEVPHQGLVQNLDGELGQRVQKAITGLQKMKEDIRSGEWTQCAEDARPVFELLNKPELVKPLLVTAGLPEDKEAALLNGIYNLLQYAHGFHHSVGHDGSTILPAVNANSEDAYLAYSVASALLNAIARKGARKLAE